MATQSSNLAWRVPWTEETGGLQCMVYGQMIDIPRKFLKEIFQNAGNSSLQTGQPQNLFKKFHRIYFAHLHVLFVSTTVCVYV